MTKQTIYLHHIPTNTTTAFDKTIDVARVAFMSDYCNALDVEAVQRYINTHLRTRYKKGRFGAGNLYREYIVSFDADIINKALGRD